jgi:16S rRNA (cytidine1402-2'-O)-methyltransferase
VRAPEQIHPAGGADAGGGTGVLYLVPTPIGNLEDVTLRALRVLREVDWVAAEDTRRARVLFQAHDIHRPLISHHAHNEHRETPRLVERLLRGESGALITDAGTPGISDPGYLLSRAAREAEVRVVVLPGPSAVLTALLASGFPPEPFLFLGYLPATSGKRIRLWERLSLEPRTVVLFEAPHRVRRSLGEAREILGERPLALLRELTKIHEERLRGSAGEILEWLGEPVRGEIVLVVGPLGRKHREGAGTNGSGEAGSSPARGNDPGFGSESESESE